MKLIIINIGIVEEILKEKIDKLGALPNFVLEIEVLQDRNLTR